MRTCYLNGEFIPESELKISAYDLSVAQGVAAFEMTRSFNGVHFKLREHLTRLVNSCRLLSIPLEGVSFGDLYDTCLDVSARNDHGPGEEHRLLIVVSPGCAPMYKDLAGVINHPFVYIADFPLRYTVQGFAKYFTEGVHCVTSTIQQVPDACIPSQAKHRSRLHFHLAQQQAPAGMWPIMKIAGRPSYDGYVETYYTEAPGANLVYVWRGDVKCIEADALPGISLATVKALTGATEDYLCEPPSTFDGVDELWLTCTPACMLPVVSLDGNPIGDGKIGPVFKDTLRKWSEMVGVNIQQQICDWDEYGPGPRDPEQYARWQKDKNFLRGTVWTPDQQRAMSQENQDAPLS